MFNRIVILAIGIILILMGVQAFLAGGYWMWGRYINYGSSHRVIGIIFMIGGLLLAYEETRIMIRDRRKGRHTGDGDQRKR
jgi:uncharacterized protein YjeT (DUF2065 family)